MEQRNTRLRNAGFVTFFFSGICTISSGVVVSLLQEEYGLSLIHIWEDVFLFLPDCTLIVQDKNGVSL